MIISVLFITVLAIVGVAYGFTKVSQKPEVTLSAGAQAVVDKTFVDWGQITYSGGKVKATYRITNSGTEVLKLFGATTSCACTSGTITANGQVTAPFGMHSTMTEVVEIASGKDAIVEALFDPAFHGPSGVGPISRTVTVQTNDLSRQTLNFQASGVVIK